MPIELYRCKITVLKKLLNQDLINEYLEDSYNDIGLCEHFREGQIFEIDPSVIPENFCACCTWAWADIRDDIMTVATGGNIPGMKHDGTIITGCRDWFRPVIFKVERIG